MKINFGVFGKKDEFAIEIPEPFAAAPDEPEHTSATGIIADVEETHSLAKAFRQAIQKCDQDLLPINFERFPNGACGVTSRLLQKYLRERDQGEFNYIYGIRTWKSQSWRSHAWLEQNGLIVDITADQFYDMRRAVLVTTDRAWHTKFRKRRISRGTTWERGSCSADENLLTTYPHIATLADEIREKSRKD